MNSLAIGAVIVGHGAAIRELHSARPDAPVVPHRAPRRVRPIRRSRNVTAVVLRRAATRISPA